MEGENKMKISDIEVGTILKATRDILDLEKGKMYIVTSIEDDTFDYNEVGKKHIDNNYCSFDEALDCFELGTITNWKDRIK